MSNQNPPEDPWAAWTPPQSSDSEPTRATPDHQQSSDSEATKQVPGTSSDPWSEPTTAMPGAPTPGSGYAEPTTVMPGGQPSQPQQPAPGAPQQQPGWGAPAGATAQPWTPPAGQPPAPPPSGQPPVSGWGGVPGQPGGPVPPKPSAASGFLSALFDFSFTKFVTPSIVKVVYVLVVIVTALAYVSWILGGFGYDTGLGVVALLFGWIPALLIIALTRVQLEYMVALIRASENTRDIKKKLDA